MPPPPKSNDWLPHYHRAVRLGLKACIVSRCGYVWVFAPAWGQINSTEVLGHRWLEYVQPYEVAGLLRWLRGRRPGPKVFDAVEFGTLRACRLALVKVDFGDTLLCIGDRHLVQIGEGYGLCEWQEEA